MAETWNPWRALRGRSHIRFALTDLPQGIDAVYWPRGSRAAILIDRSLSQRDRRSALAHELVHDERGGGADYEGMPSAWGAVVARDERAVDREVARRLIDQDELVEFVSGRTEMGEHVDARATAEWFDTSEMVAQLALELLAERQAR